MNSSVNKTRQIRRSAWALGVLAVAFYIGFIAWSALVLA
jgi:hypothetical protein